MTVDDRIRELERRVAALEARTPGVYGPEPRNWPPLGGTTDEED